MSLVVGCNRNEGQADTRLLWRGPGRCLEYDERGYSSAERPNWANCGKQGIRCFRRLRRPVFARGLAIALRISINLYLSHHLNESLFISIILPIYIRLNRSHLRLLGMDDMRPWQEALKDYLVARGHIT
jgi:hypothetical protein